MKWPSRTLGDLVTLQRGHDLTDTERKDGLIPVIGSAGQNGFHNVARTKGPGVTVGRSGGSIGKVTFVTEDYWPHNTCLYVTDFKGNNPRFVAYFLGTIDLAQLNSGAAQPSLNRNFIYGVKTRFPEPPIQERIAEILTAYDDLMENNRRRMALLEESARLLYREWFVHLRFPGHEHTRLINGVPQGWERTELRQLINVTHGYAFQGEHFSDEPTSRILTTPGNFRIGGGIKIDKPKFYLEDGPLDENYVLAPMDLVVTMTDLSKTCDTLGFPAFVPRLGGLTFLHNQRVGRVVPLSSFFPKHFLHCLLCDDRYRYHVVGAATGVAVKHTSPTRILSYATHLPMTGTLIEAFEEMAEPIFQQINCLLESTEKLRTARDLLLPRLMSGELAV